MKLFKLLAVTAWPEFEAARTGSQPLIRRARSCGGSGRGKATARVPIITPRRRAASVPVVARNRKPTVEGSEGRKDLHPLGPSFQDVMDQTNVFSGLLTADRAMAKLLQTSTQLKNMGITSAEVNSNYINRLNREAQASAQLIPAIEANDEKTVKALVLSGADVNTSNNTEGATPLHIAAKLGKLDIVQFLIKRGAKIDQRDRSSRTPLQYAVKENHLDIVKFLTSKEVIKRYGKKALKGPLNLAARAGNLEILGVLTSVTDDIEFVKEGVRTAAMEGRLEVVKFLFDILEKSAGSTRHEFGSLIWDIANQTSGVHGRLDTGTDVDIIRFLAKKGAPFDQNLKGRTGRFDTPLFRAVYHGKVGLVQCLVELGANINRMDGEGYTLLEVAENWSYTEIASYLVSHGARKPNWGKKLLRNLKSPCP